jgi:hypothetical protein
MRSYLRQNGNDAVFGGLDEEVHQLMRSQTTMSELLEAVEEDRSLQSVEKETTLTFSKSDDCASVYTEEAGLMRRLLCHPHFEVDSLRVNTHDTVGKRVAPSDFEQGSITGVDGSIPIESLVIQTSLRTTSQHSAVVPEGVLRDDRLM